MVEHNRLIYYTGCRKEMVPFVPAGSRKILEIGCGEGNFLNQFRGEGIELWGVEPDEKSSQIAGTELFRIFNGTIEQAMEKLPEGYFDAVVLNDVIEHMLYPGENLRLLKTKLSPSGRIIASVPNFRYIKSLFQVVVKGKWDYRDHGILDQTHFRFFTRKSVVSMFQDNGYDVETIKGINRTKSIKYHLLTFLFSLITFSNHLDMLFLQFAVVAKVKNQKT